MALRQVFAGFFGAALLASSAPMAAEYHPQEYFSLDLSKAVLSPNPLGPLTAFEEVPIGAKGERASEPRWAREELKAEPKRVVIERVTRPHPLARAASLRRTGSVRADLAHRHLNPLDAQAMDSRVQTWPCTSGGICNWKLQLPGVNKP